MCINKSNNDVVNQKASHPRLWRGAAGGCKERKNMAVRLVVYLVLGLCIRFPVLCLAQIQPADTIVIKNHQFNPSQLTIPAGQKIQITVENLDPTAEEFESFDLDREQVVEGNNKIIVFIGPLKPGTYGYWADYHQDSKGVIVAQ
jgi:hypothetical protein